VTKADLEFWMRGFKGKARVMIEVNGGFHPANIRYEIGKHTNGEGLLVVYPSRMFSEQRTGGQE
jgi:hypothetical protein